MPRQVFTDEAVVGQIFDPAHAVDQHDLLEALVGLGILDQADERRQPGAGGQQVEVLARTQVTQHQRAGRLAADDDLVADLQVLQPGSQRPVGYLDAEELEELVVVRAGDAVGARQRTSLLRQPEHDELAVDEAQGGIARGAEAEQSISPVVDGEDALCGVSAHHVTHGVLLTASS
ncbi:MAG: hypothetical protein AW07_03807 [Candidatus Accumulibacter sp. SK-11]|nr:MAG: hypothetical protein AW07_03807 [Candidatus Accumulibacter sp. SK-11]